MSGAGGLELELPAGTQPRPVASPPSADHRILLQAHVPAGAAGAAAFGVVVSLADLPCTGSPSLDALLSAAVARTSRSGTVCELDVPLGRSVVTADVVEVELAAGEVHTVALAEVLVPLIGQLVVLSVCSGDPPALPDAVGLAQTAAGTLRRPSRNSADHVESPSRPANRPVS